MVRLTFVTGNPGKLAEVRALVPADVVAELVQDARGYPEVQAGTLAEVTAAGAAHLLQHGLRPPFILEDSGLFVAALRGFPGVYSRYALDTIGVDGILRLLAGAPEAQRAAWFATDLAYVDRAGVLHHFEGKAAGRLHHTAAGTGGFGFDPIFIPQGASQTFGEMGARKALHSHRAQAVRQLVAHLRRHAAAAHPGAVQTGKP